MVLQSADSKAPLLELKTVEMLESTLEHKKERKKALTHQELQKALVAKCDFDVPETLMDQVHAPCMHASKSTRTHLGVKALKAGISQMKEPDGFSTDAVMPERRQKARTSAHRRAIWLPLSAFTRSVAVITIWSAGRPSGY